MIFYHFTTLRCFRKEVKREGGFIVNVFRVFLFVLLVLSKSQFKMEYSFYYAKSSAMKNV